MNNLWKAYDILAEEYTELVCDPAYFTLCKICVVRECHGKPSKEECKKKIEKFVLDKAKTLPDADFSYANVRGK